jgi:hypothetical protein
VRLRSSFVVFSIVFAALACAGPVDFGTAELNEAIAARKLKWKNQTELSLDAPETFRIEPYQVGGAHITGGDLRGLMYGLLEAAEQIRTTGKVSKTAGNPAVPLRGIRIVLDGRLETAPQQYWDGYFRMLARNRFNRIHVVFERLTAPYELPAMLSRTAAEYGIDFTLGVNGQIGAEELAHVLAICPAIRGVALENMNAPDAVFSALRVAGRRVTLDLDGGASAASAMDAAVASHVPVLRPSPAWPPSFEVAAPMEPGDADAHPGFYLVTGRLGYDPKAPPPKEADAREWAAAKEAALWIAAAQQANLGGSDYVASAGEAMRDRAEHVASAKFTPPEIAGRLYAAAGQLLNTENADLRLLAAMARELADQQLSSANLPPPARSAPPSPWTHMPPASAPSEQPLVVVLRITQPKTVGTVRLHYRPLDPGVTAKTIEMPAAAEVSFTIPAAEITGNWDLMYYFEILDNNGSGWFAPDPLLATPYWTVHVIAPHTGRN